MKSLTNNVAVYARTVAGDAKLIAEQLETIDEYLSQIEDEYSGIVVTAFADCGYSGTSLDRPQLNDLRMKCGKGEFDLLVVTEVNRLSQDPKVLSSLLLEFDEHGVAVESCDSPTLIPEEDTPVHVDMELVAKISAAISTEEKKLRSKKIKEGIKRRKNQK